MTFNEIETNEFLEYNVSRVIEYCNDFKKDNYIVKKIQKDIWQNKLNKETNTRDIEIYLMELSEMLVLDLADKIEKKYLKMKNVFIKYRWS